MDAVWELEAREAIDRIIYSEHDNPHEILGPHLSNSRVRVNVYIPTAVEIVLKTKSGKEYPMERIREEGFFSVIFTDKKINLYSLLITYDNKSNEEIYDPYYFKPYIDDTDIDRFVKGIHYNIYDKFGAHIVEMNQVLGVCFSVWAPNALRVSVVGDFNNWDGRRHTMRRLKNSGIFELFIPGLPIGEVYKYELKIPGSLLVLKADPYANKTELRPNNASMVWDLNLFNWSDNKYLSERKEKNFDVEPINIYELHLGSWKRPEDREFYNYRELAPMISDYVLEMGYTHIEVLPVMEHPFDGSWGYQVTGYYAPTARYGSPDDFMYFIDYMHQMGIGVILDWVPAHFPKDGFGLAKFDGTSLYEHADPKRGEHPHWGTLIFNYGRPEVSLFLIANALFWIDKYHVDGIRVDAVASMLYLNYGKNDGEWIANIHGGNENLEAMELFKHLNSIIEKRRAGVIIIAEESTSWPKITTDVKSGGLGFHYKWNLGWMNDVTNYMKTDPLFRKGRHNELTFSMVYAYTEKFMLVLSHDEVVHLKGSMINKMPGSLEQKIANLKVLYGFMMCHPGKKLLFMGQEFAQFKEWNENSQLSWELLGEDNNVQLQKYVKDLNRLYVKYPSLYQMDFTTEGFEWISCLDADHSIIVFMRYSKEQEEALLIVCNFTPVVYDK
ncbi:MAG: 1,4-alpha-glucan branching enzyme, partial [Anaerocolumna sp.]|nr:1,4-alpha-glucan branching enzyme [Anaerocolumna sp.]